MGSLSRYYNENETSKQMIEKKDDKKIHEPKPSGESDRERKQLNANRRAYGN